jgi:hypothetical protein
MKTFDFISDPGHGWLKVPHRLLAELAIADRISHYSYSRGSFAYLEEDCDYSTFAAAMSAAGKPFKIRDRDSANNYSRVRNYDRYSPLMGIAAALRTNAHADPAEVTK